MPKKVGVDIALFFGSFNPIHCGHTAIISEVAQRFNFQQIQLVVSPQSPYKTEKNAVNDQLAPFKDRVKMCRLAISKLNKQREKNQINDGVNGGVLSMAKRFFLKPFRTQKKFFCVNTLESKLPLPNYTHITLKEIMFSRKANYTLIVGQDNYQTLSKWSEGEWIIENFPLIVYPRYFDANQEFENSKATKKSIEVSGQTTTTPQTNEKNTHFLIDANYLPISASQVRNKIAAGEKVNGLVPHKIAQYIRRKKLYTNN